MVRGTNRITPFLGTDYSMFRQCIANLGQESTEILKTPQFEVWKDGAEDGVDRPTSNSHLAYAMYIKYIIYILNG